MAETKSDVAPTPSEWLFCRKCGWQADQPHTGMAPKCPDCRESLWMMNFSRRDWMRYGSDLLSGKLRVVELGAGGKGQ